MLARLTSALVAACLLFSAAAQAQSSDLRRLTLRNDILGWEGVGRLDLDGRGFCTGVLVASDLVMTAAHCLFDTETLEPIQPERVTFRAGVRDGEAIAERQGKRAVAHAGFDPKSGLGPERVQFDVALLQLATPISIADADPFRVDTLDAQNPEVSVVSYGVGRAESPSRQGKCTVTGRGSGMIGFDCDVTFGSSGAPVFQRREDRMRIVSLVAAGAQQDGRKITVGMELPRVFAELRSALRSGTGVWPADGGIETRRMSVTTGSRPENGSRFLRP